MTALSPPNRWRRAAVYGSLWAAVEIIVGSFLHNLRIPMAGSLLAAFGVMVMTAAHRAHAERGLIWRAALVCALMKSVSPSAVILGPMIAIFMEGLLLDGTVRLFRGRAIGYLLGGALAVSWSMVQRVLTAIVAYGTDLVRLYVDAYGFAARSLGVESFGPFDLILTLVILEMCGGVAAAAMGLAAARRAATDTAGVSDVKAGTPLPGGPIMAEGHWSLPRLAGVAAALVGGMAGVGRIPVWAGACYAIAFAVAVGRYYPRALSRLKRPALWIEMGTVMLTAGLVLGGVREGLPGLLDGLAAGLRMVLRASLVLFGFAAISIELRNPVILAWVERRKLRGMSDALGVAFAALPAFTTALSSARSSWSRPLTTVSGLLAIAEGLVHMPAERATGDADVGPRVLILTGPTGSGKTTLASAVIERLRAIGLAVGGILAPGFVTDGRRSGFDLVNLATGDRVEFARDDAHVEGPHARWSRFVFFPAGLELGRRALGDDARVASVVVVDEVGPMELSGGGWAAALDSLAARRDYVLVLVARESVVDAVNARWGGSRAIVFDAAATEPEQVTAAVLQRRP